MNMMLYCCLCMYVGESETPAVTIMGGHATCEDHMGYFQSSQVSFAIGETKRQSR